MELAWDDVAWAVRRMPFPVKAMLQKHDKLFVAGGYLRACIAGERINDIDVFAATKDYAEACAKELANPTKGEPRKIITTDNAYTVLMRPFAVQFIHRWTFTTPADALDSFDFTIAKAAIWWDAEARRWKGCADDRFYADLAAKRLVYTKPNRKEAPGGSILRVLKFYQRGYRIPLDSMGEVIARLVMGVKGAQKLWTPVELGPLLTALLREVDPLIDPNHMAHLPSASEEAAAESEGEEEETSRYVIGIDTATGGDHTEVAVIDTTTNKIVGAFDPTGMSIAEMTAKAMAIAREQQRDAD